MNEAQILTINNHQFDEENPPEKQADKCGNAWIRSTDENGIQVTLTDEKA